MPTAIPGPRMTVAATALRNDSSAPDVSRSVGETIIRNITSAGPHESPRTSPAVISGSDYLLGQHLHDSNTDFGADSRNEAVSNQVCPEDQEMDHEVSQINHPNLSSNNHRDEFLANRKRHASAPDSLGKTAWCSSLYDGSSSPLQDCYLMQGSVCSRPAAHW